MSIEKLSKNLMQLSFISFIISVIIIVGNICVDFEITLVDYTIQSTYGSIWFIIAIFLCYISTIYYLISKSRLKVRSWLLLGQFICIVAFYVFFIAFSIIDNCLIQEFIIKLGFSKIDEIWFYIFFLLGVLLLLILNVVVLLLSLLTLKYNDPKTHELYT